MTLQLSFGEYLTIGNLYIYNSDLHTFNSLVGHGDLPSGL